MCSSPSETAVTFHNNIGLARPIETQVVALSRRAEAETSAPTRETNESDARFKRRAQLSVHHTQKIIRELAETLRDDLCGVLRKYPNVSERIRTYPHSQAVGRRVACGAALDGLCPQPRGQAAEIVNPPRRAPARAVRRACARAAADAQTQHSTRVTASFFKKRSNRQLDRDYDDAAGHRVRRRLELKVCDGQDAAKAERRRTVRGVRRSLCSKEGDVDDEVSSVSSAVRPAGERTARWATRLASFVSKSARTRLSSRSQFAKGAYMIRIDDEAAP